MTKKISIGIAVFLGLFIGFSFLFGSAFWATLFGVNRLNIDGAAPQIRPISGDFQNEWTAYGGDAKGSRFSAASEITPENVRDLEVAWSHSTGALAKKVDRTLLAFEATPIFIQNKLILCTQYNEVIALEPDTGEEIWRFDPNVDKSVVYGNQYTCRGVSYWASDQKDAYCGSRIFTGTVDSRLIALDAKTGQKCTGFGNNGEVKISPSMDLRWPGEVQITSAPAIAGNTVITGSAISDNMRTNAPKGTVHAFDAITGELKWMFNPVPQDLDDPAMATWQGDSAFNTGHANAWSTISVDEERSLVILPTSSPSPDYYGGNRIGDNRYANSVVALDSDTGDVVWSFQTVHHDLWDFDVPSQPGLYQVYRDGVAHDVVVQATKMGLIFVLDRATGEPFLPIEERAVPQGGVVGEALSPTQPFPTTIEPIVPNTLDPSDAFGITFWDKSACSKRFSDLRAEGLFTPPSMEGTLTYPFTGGGANWGSTAFDPSRNLVVVNMTNIASYVRLNEKEGDDIIFGAMVDGAEFGPMQGAPYTLERGLVMSPIGLPCAPPPWGVLAGVNIDTGEIVWRKTLGTTRDLAPGGLALKFGVPNLGGPIITSSGLIFIGATMDDYLRAFDVETGEELWKGRLPAGGQATPMTYTFEGKQYVVISAGGHSSAGSRLGDHIVAFALQSE